MMVKCPNCEKEYRVDPNQHVHSILSARCKACNTHFKLDFDACTRIICPNCSFEQIKSKECKKCGVIFEKFKEQTKMPPHNNGKKISTQDLTEAKLFNWRKVWLICSILYFIVVIVDCIIVYPNERNRPKREKFYATIDLIEYYDFLKKLAPIKLALEDMSDRRERKSRIYEFLQRGCQSTGKFYILKKSNTMVKAHFQDGTVFTYDDRDSTVSLIKKKIPDNNHFKFFPTLNGLHTIYKNIDLDEEIDGLQTLYDFLDYSIIEEEYQNSVKWLNARFVLFGFLLFIIPVLIGYFLTCMINYYQRWNHHYYNQRFNGQFSSV